MNKFIGSDEEDDIESLRIAALQSLKRKQADPLPGQFNSSLRTVKVSRNKWGRFGSQGRAAKSTHFNNRVRSTNLISITPVSDEHDNSNAEGKCSLPSDKCEDGNHSMNDETLSKFNRYDKSDKSESESEGGTDIEDNPPGVLKKSDSLEALMQELDDEITGKSKLNKDGVAEDVEKLKVKKFKKKKKSLDANPTKSEAEKSDTQVQSAVDNSNLDKNNIVPSTLDDSASPKIVSEDNFPKKDAPGPLSRKRRRSRSPFGRNHFLRRQNQIHFPNVPPQPFMPFNPAGHFRSQIIPFMNPQPNPLFVSPAFNMPPQFPPFVDRPLSPLAINTESLTTATMAPLSPRSAAFVLQNKAIIEKRKRSPRRSYSRSLSRSLSRSPRRSLSPLRRSLTPPRRFRRSVSPRRFSRSPRRFSPPRKRSLSPRRRSLSPKKKAPPAPIRGKLPIQNRLGLKSENSEQKDIEKLKEKEVKEVIIGEPEDPILAARKKKFESNELKKKEGIIRLKPKEEKLGVPVDKTPTAAPDSDEKFIENLGTPIANTIETESKVVETPSKPQIKAKIPENKVKVPENKVKVSENKAEVSGNKSEVPEKLPAQKKKVQEKSKDPDEFKELERLLNDDNALEDYLLGHKVADIFSDEESASDNEGRFKAKDKQGDKVPVLSFEKLVNGSKLEIKAEPLPDSSRNTMRGRDRNAYNERRSRMQQQPSHSKEMMPLEKKKHTKPMERQLSRQKITLNSDKINMQPVEKKRERKIEIRIKNPSKYERSGKTKVTKSEPDAIKQKIVMPIQELSEDSDEELIIADSNDSGDEENAVLKEGDLRTQLSRKRAEKLHKVPPEQVSSRLLQFALQGAILKKSKKKSKRKSLLSSDGKLPIQFRLGITNPDDIIQETKVKKKKKRKNRELLEQV